MNRDEAYKTLLKMVKNKNLIKHHLACEATMKALYKKLSPSQNPSDEEKWGIVGLLHDADYELSKNHPEKHTLILEEKIGKKLSPEVMYAIKSHNYIGSGTAPKSMMDWSIYCCDELTGLIVACALVTPAKKIAAMDLDFVVRKFNERSFAKGADRKQILACEDKLGISSRDFIDICLKAVQTIGNELDKPS